MAEHSDDESPTRATSMAAPTSAVNASGSPPHQFCNYDNLMFQITWPGEDEESCSIWLVASNLQEKEAWCSDISQVSIYIT